MDSAGTTPGGTEGAAASAWPAGTPLGIQVGGEVMWETSPGPLAATIGTTDVTEDCMGGAAESKVLEETPVATTVAAGT